jgi:hypothetical protein
MIVKMGLKSVVDAYVVETFSFRSTGPTPTLRYFYEGVAMSPSGPGTYLSAIGFTSVITIVAI